MSQPTERVRKAYGELSKHIEHRGCDCVTTTQCYGARLQILSTLAQTPDRAELRKRAQKFADSLTHGATVEHGKLWWSGIQFVDVLAAEFEAVAAFPAETNDQTRRKIEYETFKKVSEAYYSSGADRWFGGWLDDNLNRLDEKLATAPMKPGSVCDIPQLPPTE